MQALASPSPGDDPRSCSPSSDQVKHGDLEARVSSLQFYWPGEHITRYGHPPLTSCSLHCISRRILLNCAVYNPAIGYSQGMCDLVAPILARVLDESDTFWCFVGPDAEHNLCQLS